MPGAPEPPSTTVADFDVVRIGRFRCPADSPRFRDSGPTGGWLVVFPRTSVWITQAGRAPVLADPSTAILYNRGQEYTRAKIAEEGDRCEWFSFDPGAVAEATGRPDAQRLFDATHAAVDARTYALQRRVFEHVARAGAVDPLFVEEASLAVLARVCRAARPANARVDRADQADRVDAVKRLIAARLDERPSLSSIASRVGWSAFHLSRVFRAHTGHGVHAYRHQLRLRASLERIAAWDDLSAIAVDLGYASHSHFTTAFARTFGETPSAFRSKIVKARWRAHRAC